MSGEISDTDIPKDLTARLIHAAAIAAICLAALSLCARWLWIGNILNHLSAHCLLLTLVLVPFVRKRPQTAAIVVIAVCMWSWPWVYQAYEKRAPQVSESAADVFMVANTAWWNKAEPEKVAQSIMDVDPDFCVVIEAHPDVAHILRRHDAWHSRIGKTKIGPYSMLLLSRLDILNHKVHVIQGSVRDLDLDMDAAEALNAEEKGQFANKDILLYELLIKLKNGQQLRVIAAHPPSPLFPRLLKDRNAVLKRIAKITAASTEPCVLLGDLNMVAASVEWRHLHGIGFLRPSGAQKRTWFTPKLIFLRQLGLAIDYIAATEGIALSPLDYVRIPGSDHLGIFATLEMQQNSIAKTP